MTREALEGFPGTVPMRNAEGTRLYERVPGAYAAKEPLDRARIRIRTELGEGWILCDGSPSEDVEAASIAPLYRLESGPPSVLTGRVFIVARSCESLESALKDVAPLGFRVDHRPRSAPAGAWLAPIGERRSQALTAIGDLHGLEALEIIQPEAITERQERG
ncbi:MAG: hypothetical protein RL885_11890 [Planctomycetota bacterium]